MTRGGPKGGAPSFVGEQPYDDAAQRPSVRPLCPARWGSEKGYIAVTHPTTGETVEIPYESATEVWKQDVREISRQRKARAGQGGRS